MLGDSHSIVKEITPRALAPVPWLATRHENCRALSANHVGEP